jgi:hypothetical protein
MMKATIELATKMSKPEDFFDERPLSPTGLDLKAWEFGDDVNEKIHTALSEILEERMRVIFGENGLRANIWAWGDSDSPKLEISICDGSGSEDFARGFYPLELLLSRFVETSEDEDERAKLKLILDQTLLKLADAISRYEAPANPDDAFRLVPIPATEPIKAVDHVVAEDGITHMLYLDLDGRTVIVQARPGDDLAIYESA